MKKLLFWVILVASMFLTGGCDGKSSPINPDVGASGLTASDEENVGVWKSFGGGTDQYLEGTSWKTVGIVDVETGLLKKIESNGCEKCFVLTFHENGSLGGNSSANEIWEAAYRRESDMGDGTYRVSISDFGGTKVHESDDGDIWWNALRTVQKYALMESELRLYYNENKNYLVFERTDIRIPAVYFTNDDSCGKSLEETSWRLSELVEVETGLQVEIEPKGWRTLCQRCYTLKFEKEGAFSTHSSVNEYRGTYSVVKNGDSVIYKISFNILFGTKVHDVTGGDQMYERILEAVEYYELQKKELKLYYNENKNYLLFNSL